MKKYFEVKENSKRVTHIKCEVYYSLGGMNYFTYKNEGRGYYLAVTPIERSRSCGITTEGFMAFSGTKLLVKPVTRKSAKAEAEAEKLAEKRLNELVDYVLKSNGLELEVSPVISERRVEETVA